MKKRTLLVRFSTLFLLGFAALLFSFATIKIASAAETTEKNVASAVKLQKYLTAQGTLTAEEAKVLDMDGNGKLNAVDLTLLKRELMYLPTETTTTSTTTMTTTTTTVTTTTTTETTTTITETTLTTTDTTTTETTTTDVTFTTPVRASITNPDGGIIPTKTFETLVNYATQYKIKEYEIVWTDKEIIEESLFVLGEMNQNFSCVQGAFILTTGEKFYQAHKEQFEAEYEDFEIDDVRRCEYIIWRHCDKKFLDMNAEYDLMTFEDSDIYFNEWRVFEDFADWALVPKKEPQTDPKT